MKQFVTFYKMFWCFFHERQNHCFMYTLFLFILCVILEDNTRDFIGEVFMESNIVVERSKVLIIDDM
jgi:hypothetical protein